MAEQEKVEEHQTRVRMRTSLRTIAKLSDVSVNTVSNILNRGKENLYKPATISRVQKVALESGYRPNFAAKILLSNASRMIGFVAWNLAPDGSINNPTVYPFLIGATARLVKDGYHLVVVSLDEMRNQGGKDIPPVLREHFFDALIIQQGRWDNLPEWQRKGQVPIVSWDSGYFDDFNCIHRNELEVGKTIATRLIELGHRRISFAWWKWDHDRLMAANAGGGATNSPSGPNNEPGVNRNMTSDNFHYSTPHRYQGYDQVMKAHNLPTSSILLGRTVGGGRRDRIIPSIAEQIIQQRPTAIICLGSSDFIAIEYATRLVGLKVPQDISVAACDVEARIPFALGIDIGGVLYDRYDAGSDSAEMCLDLLQNRKTKIPSKNILGEFVLGDTVAHCAT